MYIDQISVFMENKKGRLSSLTRTLAKNNIDLVAMSIADTSDYGIMRAIVTHTEKAEKVLKEKRIADEIITNIIDTKVTNPITIIHNIFIPLLEIIRNSSPLN